MSIQKPMTKAEREQARKRREQLKNYPAKRRDGSFKLPSEHKLKELRKTRKEKFDPLAGPTQKHRHGEPLSKKLTKKQKEKLNKVKLKIRG